MAGLSPGKLFLGKTTLYLSRPVFTAPIRQWCQEKEYYLACLEGVERFWGLEQESVLKLLCAPAKENCWGTGAMGEIASPEAEFRW